jgi:hypothetical protein
VDSGAKVGSAIVLLDRQNNWTLDIATRGGTDSSFVIISRCNEANYHAGNTNSFSEITLFDKDGTLTGSSEQFWEMPNAGNYPAMVESGSGELFIVNTPSNGSLVSFSGLNPKGYTGSIDSSDKALEGSFWRWNGPKLILTPNPMTYRTLYKKAKIEFVATLTSTYFPSTYTGGSTYSILQNHEHFTYFEINPANPTQLSFRGDLLTSALPPRWKLCILTTDATPNTFYSYHTFEIPPTWHFTQNPIQITNQILSSTPPRQLIMGNLKIAGIDMPSLPGQSDTFAAKGFVPGQGDTDNNLLSISEVFGQNGFREYVVRLVGEGPSACMGRYVLGFRYGVVDREGGSDVHAQEVDFGGPTGVELEYLGRVDSES